MKRGLSLSSISRISTKRNGSSMELITVTQERNILVWVESIQIIFYFKKCFLFPNWFFKVKPVRLGAICFKFKVGCLVMKSQSWLKQIKSY